MTDFDDAFTETEVIRGMPFEQYLAIDAVNNSRLKHLRHSPRRFFENPGGESTKSQDRGTLAHCAVLEPSELLSRYVSPPPGMRRDKRTKAYQEFLADQSPGVEVVLAADLTDAKVLADHLNKQPELKPWLGKDTEREVTIIWTDQETGVRCKCRLDCYSPELGILDLKTTQDCSPAAFPWDAKKYGYFKQGAFYRRGVMAAIESGNLGYGWERDNQQAPFSILAAELGPPPDHVLYGTRPSELDVFHDQISDELRTIAECARSGKWHGANGGVSSPLTLEYPGALDTGEELDDEIGEDWGE